MALNRDPKGGYIPRDPKGYIPYDAKGKVPILTASAINPIRSREICELKFTGDTALIQQMNRLSEQLNTGRQRLYNRIGYGIYNWIQKNFEDQGTERPWKKLSPGTLHVKTVFNRHTRTLDATGELKKSFQVEIVKNQVRVYSPLKRAVYAQYGTRGHYIDAKKKKALSFPVFPGYLPRMEKKLAKKLSPVEQLVLMVQQNTTEPRLPVTKKPSKQYPREGTVVLQNTYLRATPPRPLLPSPREARRITADIIKQYIADARVGG